MAQLPVASPSLRPSPKDIDDSTRPDPAMIDPPNSTEARQASDFREPDDIDITEDPASTPLMPEKQPKSSSIADQYSPTNQSFAQQDAEMNGRQAKLGMQKAPQQDEPHTAQPQLDSPEFGPGDHPTDAMSERPRAGHIADDPEK